MTTARGRRARASGSRLLAPAASRRAQSLAGMRHVRATDARDDRWFLYLARCGDGSLYTGIARDVRARIAAHDAGRGARYTRGRGPITLAASARCNTKGDALRLEHALKGLPRERKLSIARAGLGAWARRTLALRRARRNLDRDRSPTVGER